MDRGCDCTGGDSGEDEADSGDISDCYMHELACMQRCTLHSNHLAKGLKRQQKRYVAQAVSVAPLQSGNQIRRNLLCDSPPLLHQVPGLIQVVCDD